MGCLDENVLSEHLARRLGSTETARVTSHLDECASCADLMMDLARAYPAEPSLVLPSVGPSGESTSTRGGQAEQPGAHAHPPPKAIGRYIVLAPVGAGGMGVVFAAYDPKLDRKVAIKLLRTRAGSDDASQGAQQKLMLEARTMARLSHPNVLVVHDVGSHDGQVFLVADFVDGGTLRTWLAREERAVDAIVAVMAQAARGLAAAHKAGLVHRDFKPDNVLVSRDGRVYVADFGLTCATPALGADRDAAGYVTAGTPAYMAPEVRLGVEADEKSDQYGFFVTLHQALFGDRPAASAPAEDSVSLASASDSPVPEELRAVLRRGLALHAPARFASMDEVIAELTPFTSEGAAARASSAAAVSAAAAAREGGGAGRRRTRIGIGVGLGVLLAVAVGVGVAGRGKANANAGSGAASANATAGANAAGAGVTNANSAGANANAAGAGESAAGAGESASAGGGAASAGAGVAIAGVAIAGTGAAGAGASGDEGRAAARARARAPRTTARGSGASGGAVSEPPPAAASGDPLRRHY